MCESMDTSDFTDFLDGISFDLDDDAQNSEHMDLPSCSGNSSDSCTSDFCNSPSRKHERTTSTCSVFKSASNEFDVAEDFFPQHNRLPQKDLKKNMQTSTYKVFKSASNEFDGNYFDENYRVPKKDLKNNVQQTKPRRKRQNISRRPGETDAQLKERRYQAKLRRNRESGKRARKRRKDTVGTLKLEQEQLLEQIHTKLLIVKRLEQQNEQLKQELIDEQAANHPLFNHNGSRARDRRYQESEAPPLTIFAVAFVALLTWSAALESSSLYGPHSTETPSRAKIFPAGAPASLGTPAAVVALESLLQYTLQMHQDYWHVWKAFIQLMAIFIFSMCVVGLYPSMKWSTPKVRARCRCHRVRVQSDTRSTRVSFTSSSTKRDGVRVQHTRHRRVVTYII